MDIIGIIVIIHNEIIFISSARLDREAAGTIHKVVLICALYFLSIDCIRGNWLEDGKGVKKEVHRTSSQAWEPVF